MLRRIQAELKRDWGSTTRRRAGFHDIITVGGSCEQNINGYNCRFIYLEKINDYIYLFRMEIEKFITNITITHSPDYPFKPPANILVNGYDYLPLLRSLNRDILRQLAIPSDTICLCCSSLTCGDNWSPQNNMKSLLIEIATNMISKLRLNEKRHGIKMCKNFVGHSLPIIEFL